MEIIRFYCLKMVGLRREETQYELNRFITEKTKIYLPLPQTEKPCGSWE